MRNIASSIDRHRRPGLRLALFAVLALWSAVLCAQAGPTGLQEYFVLGYEQHVWDMMNKVVNGPPGPGQGGGPLTSGMNSVVTAVATADAQVIYYDHWEDGLEADIFNPVQASTLVIGDANAANGDACDFNSDPCGTDVLLRGDFVNFESKAGLLAGCTIPSASPLVYTQLCSSVPVNPRCATAGACTAAEVRFDGGDYLETTGGPLSLVHSQDPLTQFIGGSTEVISKQAVQAARSYSVPIGQNLYAAFGCPNCVMEPFHYVDLNLVAFEDNTQIFVTSPLAGTASFTLQRGEHWSSLGRIDDGPIVGALALTINSGTKVSTTAPVAGMMFTGGDGTWATRHYTLLPDILHSTDYVITAPGDDPAVLGSTPNRPANIYIFNPDPLNPVTVTTTDTVGSNAVVVAPNSVVDYFNGTGRFVPNGSTVRLTSNRNFWGISAYDYNTNISDWGHSWLATKFLTKNYTVSYAPGTLNPPVDMVNLSAVFVAATADNTHVQVDFDNDGVFDVIDFNGDGVPDPAPLPGNTYVVNALGSLRVFDPNDFDNTGTRIVANKPVALAWGQDTDLTDFGDTALDTGFTIYPTDQLFLDSVLVLTKTVADPVVPIAGGVATYTVTIQTFGFFPITNLLAWDLLPPGVMGSDYVPGSTLVTYPDLTQDTADPLASIDPATGRDRLDWTLSPDSMQISQTLTIRYSVAIPPAPGGTPRLLTNEAHAQGNLGASIFSPFDTADVVQTDVVLTKTVDKASAKAGDLLTYTLNVTNNNVANRTNAVIRDAIPPDTTFEPGSITSSGPFTGAYSAAQNAVVWTAAVFPPGGPHALSFQVRVNPGVLAGTTIPNSASFESDQTPFFPSNEVETVIVAPRLLISKTGQPGTLLHPNEIATFEVLVENAGDATATNLLLVDPIQPNATYIANSMSWHRNTDPFVAVTDAADADAGTAFAGQVELAVATLGAGQDLTFRFRVRVDPGTVGLFVNNQATVSSTTVPPKDSNLVQIPIVGNADITGHVFLDLDGDGNQDPGEPDLANVDVMVTDALGNVQTTSTDTNGDYLVTVAPGNATLDVDETDPDFPTGATLTTANDPQVVLAVAGATVASGDVGYDPRPLTFTKRSDAPASGLVPGDTVTYTLEATNYSGIDQTSVTVTDPLPAGTLAVPGSTVVTVTNPVFRVREYFIALGAFGGTVFDLTLDQALAPDYFAVVQGSAGGGGTGGDRDPEADYARLTQDPLGTGDLAPSAGPAVLRLERRDGADDWVGVVTVVECLGSCAAAGFRLLTVEEVLHAGASASGTDTAAVAWTDLGRVMLMGGFQGAGCYSDDTTPQDHPVCHARLFPSGTNQINWTRDGSNPAVNLSAATSTVMVVQWGSEWTVQRVRVTGTNGGNGLNAAGEYNTAAIAAVARDRTWVWGTGHANGGGIGSQAEGAAITLGNGVAQNASETLVAVGTEIAGTAVDFEVWALTHPSLAVDYRFKADGDGANLTVDVPVDAAGSERMAIVTNGQDGTSNNYPRPIFSTRYLNDSLVRLERRRSGSAFPAWVQGIDFSAIGGGSAFAGGDPPGLVTAGDGVALGPGATLTVTFQVRVDPNLAPGVTQITNTATLDTDQEAPINAAVTDDVIRPAVTVEPNNGNFVVFDAVNPQTRTYSHAVTNTGDVADSYVITAFSELGFANPGAGWIVELIDRNTGTVIATDTDFSDGTWDGGLTINTGTLAPGGSIPYDVRVTVPAGTPKDTEETTTLSATSDLSAAVFAFATDETTVVGTAGPVVLVSDQSGIVAVGGSIAYSHRIFNNTGAADTFDLTAYPSQPGWTSTIYNDSNGDGVYTPGIDVAINNTLQLPDGASQLFFVVVDAPAGAGSGDTDVTSITAISRNDPDLFDAVSDTTTVLAASTHDLSGGDTLLVAPGDDCVNPNDCPRFPGTLKSLSGSDDEFDFAITASPFFGLDGLNHPTQLWIDTDADGVPDTRIAEDFDGDGTWDFIAPGYNSNADAFPDVPVAAGTELAYGLRRPVDPLQTAYRDPITLTAISRATGEKDSVTATNLLAAATHAMLASFEAWATGGGVVVEWETSMEHGTAGFVLRRSRRGNPGRERLHRGLLPALRDAPAGGRYRWHDAGAATGASYVYTLEEVEVDGARRFLGHAETTGTRGPARGARTLPAGGFSSEARRPFAARPRTDAESAQPSRSARPRSAAASMVKLIVREPGLYFANAASLATAFGVPESEVRGWIATGGLRLDRGDAPPRALCPQGPPDAGAIFADGFESGDLCAWAAVGDPLGGAVAWLAAEDDGGLYFYGQGIDSIYTDDNVYWLRRATGAQMAVVDGGSPAAVDGLDFADQRHFEEEGPFPLTSVIEDPDSDFWFWSFVNVTPGAGVAVDTMSVTIETPGRVATAAEASMAVHLQAETSDDAIALDHVAEVRLNGTLIGSASWDGSTAHRLELAFSPSHLADGANTLEIRAPHTSGIASEIFYLDAVDLRYRRRYAAVGDRLTAAADGHPIITLEGFTRDDVTVLDVTVPERPLRVANPRIEAAGGGFAVSFVTASPAARYLAQPLATAAAATVVADEASNLHSPARRADYLVIAAAGLEAAAEDLAAYRRSQGFETLAVRLQDVYDEFNRGVVSPWAIRDFLGFARAVWQKPPRYVVLAGDSSFDFKDRLGFGGNLLPSPMVGTPEGLFPSDHRLADLTGDGVPEVAVGRLPARDDAQLAAYVAKLRAYEAAAGAWKSRTIWVADGIDEGGEFIDDTEWLIERVPAGLGVDRIYVDVAGQAAARQRLLDAFNAGALLVHFLGHGNLVQMGDGAGLLRAADVPALTGGERQPVLVAMTCALGRFDRIVLDTLSETLVLDEGGGAIALWAPTGFSFNEEALLLADGFLPAAFANSPRRLGDAVIRGLENYLAMAETPRQFIPFVYTLLGDPLIRLQP